MQEQPSDLQKRADRIAARWNLELERPLKSGGSGLIYKVDTRTGKAVLKINRKLGAEGGAVPFMKLAPVGVAPKLIRASPLRRAILMEWVEGPSLLELYMRGNVADAEALLAQSAAMLKNSNVRYPFAFANIATGLSNRFKKSRVYASSGPDAKQFLRAIALFEHLIQTTRSQTIIHGDLHFANVISTPNGPRMIDAKGFRSDPAADCARALLGPEDGLGVEALCNRILHRASIYAPIIQEEPLRIIQWGAVFWANAFFSKGMRSGSKTQTENPFLARFLDLAEG